VSIGVLVTTSATARARTVVLFDEAISCVARAEPSMSPADGVLIGASCGVAATFRVITAGSGTGDEERRRKDREEAEKLSKQQQVTAVPPRPGPFIITPIMTAPTDPAEEDGPFGFFIKES
jgi:hypothetical protein